VFGGVFEVVWKVKFAAAAPPEIRLTLVGATDQVGQPGQTGGGDALRLTVPLKPLRLFTLMLVKVEDPACRV
jgi:hypothetical protein